MSAPMIDSYSLHPPHMGMTPARKPLPSGAMTSGVAARIQTQQPPSPRFANFAQFSHAGMQHNQHHQQHQHQHQQHNHHQQSQMYASPVSISPPGMMAPGGAPAAPYGGQGAPRRQTSNSNSSTGSRPPNNQQSSSSSSNSSSSAATLRRSSSSRSTPPSSYVALLRKQKATVWCDRSQAEDPRIAAAQRLAKERAEREVSVTPGHSNQTSNRTPPPSNTGSFTTGVARKIRHHGAQKAAPYAGGNLAGAGVPMRLSASEVDDDDDLQAGAENHNGSDLQGGSSSFEGGSGDWGQASLASGHLQMDHKRTSSGRSSDGSQRHVGSGSADTPTGANSHSPVEDQHNTQGFITRKPTEDGISSPSDDEDREKREEELRRRGSVDDRTMTMSQVKLFIANPDDD